MIRKMLSNDTLLISKNCPNLIREMSIWSYKKGLRDFNSSDKFESGNDHLIDCLGGFVGLRLEHRQYGARIFSMNMPGKPDYEVNNERPAEDPILAAIAHQGVK